MDYAYSFLHAKPSDALTFDAEKHEYKLSGVPLPSVTQIINAILPLWEVDQWYLDRGAAVHHGCRLLDEGRLDWGSVDPEIEPRIRAWEKFRRDWKAEMVACEKPMASSKYRYAGTMDRLFAHKCLTVIDIKNSYSPQVRLQLAAYSLLCKENKYPKIGEAVTVELLDDGYYRTHWMPTCDLRRAEQQFLALLTTFNFAREHKILRDQ